MQKIYEDVKNYYSETLQKSSDLQTNACCTLEKPAPRIAHLMRLIHDEVMEKYYGCGLCIPHELYGLNVLDLGSGSGRDVFLASALVGSDGTVTGIDMTEEQLDVAERYKDFHAKAFGYDRPNTRFLQGNIDHLDQFMENSGDKAIPPGSIDLVISNCVLNLSQNKKKVLKDVYALLKNGGEMYFSDVYCDRRLSPDIQSDPILYGECLAGALYWNDFLRMAREAGFSDPRVVKSNPITIENEALENKVAPARFYSVTYRLMKISGLEDNCEDYGQAVAYNGTIDALPKAFDLDAHHHFPMGKIIPVCGNTYRMLHDTRFQSHFDFMGNWETHYGIFEGCGQKSPFTPSDGNLEIKTSCC